MNSSHEIEQGAARVFRPEDVEIGPKLGEGSYGQVYEGFNKVDNVKCAIKKVSVSHKKVRAYTMKEINALESLQGKSGIIQLMGYIDTGDFIYIVMNLCQTDLSRFCQRLRDSLEKRHILRLALLILDGVEQIHKVGVIHRDLKPENILLKYDKSVYQTDDHIMNRKDNFFHSLQIQICDFGVCGKPFGVTRLGTPSYLAPEVDSITQQTTKVDLYSLGVIFYQLFTKHNYRQFDQSLFDREDSDIREIISKMLSQDPQNRPQVQEVIQILGLKEQMILEQLQTVFIDQQEIDQTKSNESSDFEHIG